MKLKLTTKQPMEIEPHIRPGFALLEGSGMTPWTPPRGSSPTRKKAWYFQAKKSSLLVKKAGKQIIS